MGQSVHEPLTASGLERERSRDLIRPADRRRDFVGREAQRHLQRKEGRWAPIVYGVFVSALLVIFFFAYTSYAFSKYRGEILPGTHVDQLQLGGLTAKQAENVITDSAAHLLPVRLMYHGIAWHPTQADLGVAYDYPNTAQAALQVGRQGSFIEQWIDRFPLHPGHAVALIYKRDDRLIRSYVVGTVASSSSIQATTRNARLTITAANGYHVQLDPSQAGTQLDIAQAIQSIYDALGALSEQTVPLRVNRILPTITDSDAIGVRDHVERFLSRPPVIGISVGKNERVFVMSRNVLGPMLSFSEPPSKGRPSIVLHVDTDKVRAYVATLAQVVDRPAVDAKLQFYGGQVRVIQPLQSGSTLDQVTAFQKLLPAIQSLRPSTRLRLAAATTQPPVQQSNPASLGISTLLGEGVTSFGGARSTRLRDITAIAKSLDQDLLAPGQDISFNTLIGTGWDNRVYADRPRMVNGKLVPAESGAMQQVATTFFRALYASGLKLEERHAHTYRLPWYEPPYGLDAVVAPGRGWDLRFANSANKYLLIQTRVEPIRQELYIYIYGPKLGWHVSVDPIGKLTRVIPHGPQIARQDPALTPGQVRQISWALNGGTTVIQRSITYANGGVHADEIVTTYQPSSAIITLGSAPTPSPAQATSGKKHPTATPSPGPSATPTFSH